ncbi:MAG: hypothetical protein A2314_05445 [Elusimicrobia bacterium RIFOXYB2_FULL_50_12]|nr:MAG: hypothetical protein A2314_05445 [Elusimicrobia bacterium RIFOXYB2_FULL_50_12]
MQLSKKWLVKILCPVFAQFLLFSPCLNAGTLLMQYGFEDALPYPPYSTASPGNGWPFTSVASAYWGYFTNGTNVVYSVGNIQPRSGNKFWAFQFCTTQYDPYIEKTATSIDAHINIGLGDVAYPTGTHDLIDLSTDVKSDTLTIRYWFALYGNWTSSQTAIGTDGQPRDIDAAGMKFIRAYADGGNYQIGILGAQNNDDSDLLFHHTDDGGMWNAGCYYPVGAITNLDNKNWTCLAAHTASADNEPGVGADYTAYWQTDGVYHSGWSALNLPAFQTGLNLKNGWHSFVYQVKRLSPVFSYHNYKIDAYWDDWDMTGTQGYHYSCYVTAGFASTAYSYINVAVNWGASYPQTLMGMVFDDFEVWDGSPNTSPPDTSAPATPDGLRAE